MAKTKVVQNSFVSGVMNEKAFGRTDIAKFYNSVAEADNVLLHVTGGLFKRPGFEYVDTTNVTLTQAALPKTNRLIDFVFSTEQKYLFLLREGNIDIYHVPDRFNGDAQEPIAPPFATVAEVKLTANVIKELSVVQRGDVTILFHTDFQPLVINRIGYEDFTIGPLNVIPPLDVNSLAYWDDTLGWPSYATFFQGRLYCAGSKTYPLTIWGSKSQDYFDFDIAIADADADGSPITDTIDSDKINVITGIFSGRNLQVFTTGAEFVNRAQVITPLDSAWAIQTRNGSDANVALDALDGSTFYIDRYSAVRQFIYDYNQDAHISNDLTTLSSNLFSNPFRIEIIKSAKDTLGRFTYILNDDGTVVILNFNQAEGIVAWVKLTTVSGFIMDITTVDNEFYMLVNNGNEIQLERLDLDDNITYLDSFTKLTGNKPIQQCGETPLDVISCGDSVGGDFGIDYFLDNVWCPSCIIFTDPNTPPDTTISGLDRFNGQEVSYVLDGIYQGEIEVANGEVIIDRLFSTIMIGYKFNSRLLTLPISSPQFQMELAEKRVVKMKLFLFESSGFNINNDFIASSYFGKANYDESSDVRTGVYEYWTLGWDTFSQINIHADDPLGFNILKYELHVDVTE